MEKIIAHVGLVGVTCVAVVLFTQNITSFPLANWDEAWYAQMSKTMVVGDTNPLFPFWNGRYYFDKPPLYNWATAVVYTVAGIGEWQARLVSVVASVIGVAVVYAFTSYLTNPVGGIVGAFSFMTFGQVVQRLGAGNLDATMICFLIASSYVLMRAKTHKAYLVSGVLLGLGILTKGWVFGGVYTCVNLLFVLLIKQDPLRARIGGYGLFVVGALITCGWWFAAGVIRFGQPFISWYLFDPAAGNFTWKQAVFNWQYISDFVRDIGFWFLPLGISMLVTRWTNMEKMTLGLLSVSVISYVVLLSFSSDKLGWYLLVVYPFVAMLVGISTVKLYNLAKVGTVVLVVSVMCVSLVRALTIRDAINDTSIVGARVGRALSQSAPIGTVVLDDSGFPTVLYYSGLGRVMVLDNKAKPNEWWSVDDQRLNELLWAGEASVITKQPTQFISRFPKFTIDALPEGFYLIRP